MRIVGLEMLDDFSAVHSDARAWIANWAAETEAAKWRTPQDVKDRHASASFLADNVVIFNVKGNKYRLETLIPYNTGVVIVVWIGTHAAYERRSRRKLQ